ncbi:hypothetical protein ACQ4PT_011111 [Festuca glaucescens]
MESGFEESRAAEPGVCQEQGAIAVLGKKNVQLGSMPRVKVYRLRNDGGWDDRGTGHVTIDYLDVSSPKILKAFPSSSSKTTAAGGTIPVLPMEHIGSTSPNDVALAVIDEEDNETMLLHRITLDEIYKQEETFIEWRDHEAGMTLCLSFQEAAGCSDVWNVICEVRRKQKLDFLQIWFASDTNGRIALRSASDTNARLGLRSAGGPNGS